MWYFYKLVKWSRISFKDFPFLNIFKDIINKILHSEYFDHLRFINYFFSQNNEFRPNEQNCSQLFIRTFFYNINEEILKNTSKLNICKDVVYCFDKYYPRWRK